MCLRRLSMDWGAWSASGKDLFNLLNYHIVMVIVCGAVVMVQ